MPSRSWSVFSWSIVSTPSSQQKLVGGIRLATAGFPSPSKRLIPFWRFGSESVQWPYNAYYPRYRKFSFSGPQWLSRFSVDLGIKFWLRQRRVLCDYCLKIWTVVFLFRGLLKTHISLNGKTVSDGRQFKVWLIPWFCAETKELMTLQIPQSGWNLAVSAVWAVSVSSCQCWNVWRCKLSKLRQPDNQAMALSWTAWWAAYPQATLSLAKVWAQRRCISVVWTC